METISRLTQLYSDTKTSCDAVVEQDTKDPQPETSALHRKFRIQKDRLITWGVDWSDNSKGKQGDIDESVDQAGLTETVTSVLGTIREISDEAERLMTGAPVGKTRSGQKRPASDAPSWAAADRSRYEDLIRDLTTSIDILYDLSRTRRSQRAESRNPSPHSKAGTDAPRPPTSAPVYLSTAYSASDLTLVNPATFPLNAFANVAARSNLPPKLNQSDLILPQEEPPPYESIGIRTRHSLTSPWKTDGGRTLEIPVLVEYATYDSAYLSTGVPPPTERLERLLSILTKLSTNQSFHGTLKCLGYFEDTSQPRFGLIFELPTTVYSGPSDSHKSVEDLRPVTLLSVLQTGSKSLHSSNSATPPLEDRFRLAFTLALTFSKIHGDGFVHKDINSSNIMVFRKSKRQSANTRALQYSLRSPVICSFDLFSEYDLDPANKVPALNIYRHPEDPKFTGVNDTVYGSHFDIYSLGLILLEIGLWQPLADLWKPKYTLNDFKRRIEDVYIRRLASKCGTAYMQVVRDCFWAADSADGQHDTTQLYARVILRLQRCCMLDESEPGFDVNEHRPGANPIQTAGPLKRKSVSQPQILSESPASPPFRSAKRWAIEKGTQALERTKSLSKSSPKSPDLGLSRMPSQRSQHSIRKSISESLRLMSPKHEAAEPMDWEERDPLDQSGKSIISFCRALPCIALYFEIFEASVQLGVDLSRQSCLTAICRNSHRNPSQ
jgi:serine/threonine protein kinase